MKRAAGVMCAVVLVVTGCSSSKTTVGASSGSSAAAQLHGSITVLAASSLTEVFGSLGKAFEAAHPGTHITFSYGASSALALQINQGAPADVFASAAPKNMQQVIAAGGATTSSDFVKNVMEIAVPPGNPAHVTSVTDLARSGVKVAVCQPQVPCGATAAQVFTNAHITVHPVTLEQDVKSTLTKVELDEVDAGVVYVSDVRAAGPKVHGIVIPAVVNAATEYPIAALSRSKNAALAQAFVAFVLSAPAQSVLHADGFLSP
jgi:molybdate transport system substrate-binding protein